MKTWAKAENVAVFLLHQTNRVEKVWDPPTEDSARSAGYTEADVVIGIGTRYSDFTTASKTQFENPDVKFVNINVAEFDAFKHYAVPVIGDAKATLEELARQELINA